MPFNILSGEAQASDLLEFAGSGNIIPIKLSLVPDLPNFYSILTFPINEVPVNVTLCPQRCLRLIPEAYGRKSMPIY